MTSKFQAARIEFGDFQTPLGLAKRVCEKLNELDVSPHTILEPTCGVGAFVEAAASAFPNAKKIIGVEINDTYLDELENRKKRFAQFERVQLRQADFFELEWDTLALEGSVLVVGNLPWVTNSQQGAMGGANLPQKNNFQNHNGISAITGSSNFDISEWMLIQMAKRLRHRKSYLAMLCKTSVARKFLNHLYLEKFEVLRSVLYGIDAKRYFDVSVDACVLFCEFDARSHNYDYDVYENMDSTQSYRVGHRGNLIVRDLATFERLRHYYGRSAKWRSGIKHDCSEIMEFQKIDEDVYVNGLEQVVTIEPSFLYPLLKGSDVANGRIHKANRYALVTQKAIGEPTNSIERVAPKTWAYLQAHSKALDARKSRIYKDNPRFAIFGVGAYTFAPFKIAICGLYKKLAFQLVRPIEGKPVVFDDTVYFLSFHDEQEAIRVFNFLNSPQARDFYSTLIFWDEKRPIKSSVLNSLDLQQFETAHPDRLF